jgi:hypothetical protein
MDLAAGSAMDLAAVPGVEEAVPPSSAPNIHMSVRGYR